MDIYRAIADRTRRAILDELVDRSGQTLFELCARLIMKHGISSSRQAISQHLDVLESAGLIRTRREGRSKLHWFEGAPLKGIGERWPISTDRDKSQDQDASQDRDTSPDPHTSHSTDEDIEQ